jgi:hypothetical protein
MKLTTDHPTSSYNMPVLVIHGKAYGPRDSYNGKPCAEIVQEMAEKGDEETKKMAKKFLLAM